MARAQTDENAEAKEALNTELSKIAGELQGYRDELAALRVKMAPLEAQEARLEKALSTIDKDGLNAAFVALVGEFADKAGVTLDAPSESGQTKRKKLMELSNDDIIAEVRKHENTGISVSGIHKNLNGRIKETTESVAILVEEKKLYKTGKLAGTRYFTSEAKMQAHEAEKAKKAL